MPLLPLVNSGGQPVGLFPVESTHQSFFWGHLFL
jgi:hypothetical protein